MFLSKRDIKELNETLVQMYGKDILHKKDKVEQKEIFILKNDKILFFLDKDKKPVPTLKFLQQELKEKQTNGQTQQWLKVAIIDMPAVPFMIKGADVMRPGIKSINTAIKKDDIVLVCDETHKQPICITRALFDGQEIETMNSGKVLKNIHYVGDDIWNAC